VPQKSGQLAFSAIDRPLPSTSKIGHSKEASTPFVHVRPLGGRPHVATERPVWPVSRERRPCIRKAGRWRGDETKAPVDGRGFRAGSSDGWMGGVTGGPQISSTERPAKGSIRAIARWPPLSAAYRMRDHLALCFPPPVRRGDDARPWSNSHGPCATFPVMIDYPPLHLEDLPCSDHRCYALGFG